MCKCLLFQMTTSFNILCQCRHLIEPRFDEFKSASEKLAAFSDYNVEDLTLSHFRQCLGSTPLMAAGGFSPDNFQDGLQSGAHDLMAFGRFFV